MTSLPITTLACALAFALIHLFVGHLRFLDAVPRSRWLSMAGGVAVAYVFLHILPELAAEGRALAEATSGWLALIESHIYGVALLGLTTFYGLERMVKASRARAGDARGEDRAEAEIFWIHIGSFALYNVLVGFLLVDREDDDWLALALFVVAIALHFVTNDFGLRQDHKRLYDRAGRWVVAAAVLVGWAIGVTVGIPEAFVAIVFAFLAGGIVLNVLKEELPEERQSRFGAFFFGVAGYAMLLLVSEAAMEDAAGHGAAPAHEATATE